MRDGYLVSFSENHMAPGLTRDRSVSSRLLTCWRFQPGSRVFSPLPACLPARGNARRRKQALIPRILTSLPLFGGRLHPPALPTRARPPRGLVPWGAREMCRLISRCGIVGQDQPITLLRNLA